MPKYAVILNTTKNTEQFHTSFGFYNKQIKDLERAGDEILKIDVESINSINQLRNLPKNSVGFFWFRMHGSYKSMTASETLIIDLSNINIIFDFLPAIMSINGIIFLDACDTGNLRININNMQFAFAKLTLKNQIYK